MSSSIHTREVQGDNSDAVHSPGLPLSSRDQENSPHPLLGLPGGERVELGGAPQEIPLGGTASAGRSLSGVSGTEGLPCRRGLALWMYRVGLLA